MSEERARMSSVLGVTGLVLGNVQGQGDFEVRGRVQGDIVLEGRVLVAAGGVVLGRIEAVHISVGGTVRGDLLAQDGIEISGSGQVEGNVTSPRVAIEAGAKVRGHLRTGEEPKARDVAPRATLAADDVDDDSEDLESLPPALAEPAPTPIALSTRDASGPSAKRRRRRRRNGEREGRPEREERVESAPPATDSAGTSASHVDDARLEITPPARPTRPSGPLPPREPSSEPRKEAQKGGPRKQMAGPTDSPERPRRGKPLPTFVKGARGHLRG